jgi:hypothetical protein
MNKSEFYLKIMEIAAQLVRTEIEQNKFIHDAGSSNQEEDTNVKRLFDYYTETVEKKFFQLMGKGKAL